MSTIYRDPIVIPSAGTDSPGVDVAYADSFTIYAPAALTGTISIQVSPNNEDWFNLQDAGVDINIGVNEAITVTVSSVLFVRLHSSMTEAADRSFEITISESW